MSATPFYDVIVIGSGGGGAPITHKLVSAGKSVLVIEKGPFFRPQADDPLGVSDYKRDELISDGPEKRLMLQGLANTGASFYTSHIEPDLNDEPHVYRDAAGRDYATIEGYTCQCVGGGTQHYGGVSLRFSPTDFRLRSFNDGRTGLPGFTGADLAEIRDWPITYDQLEKYYCEAELLVGINGTRAAQIKPASVDHYQTPLDPNPISEFAFVGMRALGMTPYRTPQAVITQDHAPSGRRVAPEVRDASWAGGPKAAYVNRYGDPLEYKSTTWVSFLRPASRQPGFTLWPNCNVTHLEADGAKISRVHVRDASGRQLTVSGKIVVVACSAIESVRLLKLSGEIDPRFAARVDPHGLLGRYFLTHCFGGASAVMPERYDKSLTIDSDWATDHCGTIEFIQQNRLWAGATIYNNTSDQALPIALGRTHGANDLDSLWQAFNNDTGVVGDAFKGFLDTHFNRRLSVSFMANQMPQRDNRIELHPTIRDKWGRRVAYIIKTWHAHDEYLMDTLATRCRDVLAFGGDNGQGKYPVEGFGGVYKGERGLSRIANHILGGARFGTDPSDSVLDADCRVWQFDNLYVGDGAFMPTSGSANPTLTIQANALRVGDILRTRV